MALGGLVLGSLILDLKGMRIMMFRYYCMGPEFLVTGLGFRV